MYITIVSCRSERPLHYGYIKQHLLSVGVLVPERSSASCDVTTLLFAPIPGDTLVLKLESLQV